MTKSARSAVFRKETSLSKDEQEERVAAIFAEGYRREKSIALGKGRRVKRDPPDWVFSGSALTVGVEMFELFQFYPSRALMEKLTNAIYAQFEKRGLSRRYLGSVVTAGLLLRYDTNDWLRGEWRARGVRQPVRQAAREFVDIVAAAVPSVDMIPENDLGLRLEVDPGQYPALAVVCNRLSVHKSRDEDERRSDGRAAPLVILSPGLDYSDQEIVRQIESKLHAKMDGTSRWSVAGDQSVLVAHDLPREQMYEGFAMEWSKWIKRAATRLKVLDVFDEVWLVTFQTLEGQASLMCSRGRIGS